MIEWFVGVDWGSEAHQVCIIDGEGSVRGERSFTHTGSGLAEMAAWLIAQAGAAADVIGVAIEVPHGPVVEALTEHGFVVHSLNPKQLDRFRDRFSPAGAKDDRRDARVLADALRTDRRFFRRLDPVDPEVVELREWTRIADDLTAERTRLVNRVCVSSSGATTRRFWPWKAISPRHGSSNCGNSLPRPPRPAASARKLSPAC